MRLFTVILISVVLIILPSCGAAARPELTYQTKALEVDAKIVFEDMSVPLLISLDGMVYGSDGRMLSRDAVITVGEDSMLEGISFVKEGGDYYITAGELRIPVEDEETVERISLILSLFCIREECYHSSEEIGDGKKVIYREGEDSVSVELSQDGMPTKIAAVTDGQVISADIRSIKVK